MIEIVLVAAVAENGVIGRDNVMPWRLQSDLQRFKALTWGKPILMGRKTFQSIGKPLPGRTSVVVSRNFSAVGVAVACDIECALAVARADALRRGVGEVLVIGGAQIYAALLPLATRIELTRVHATPSGDAKFPAIEPAEWNETWRGELPSNTQNSSAITFLTFRRATRTVP